MSNSLLKIFVAVFFCVAVPLGMQGADYKDLSNECQGQILILLSDVSPYSFLELDEGEEKMWKCTNLSDSSIVNVDPANVSEILPLYLDSDPFEVISYVLSKIMDFTKTKNYQEFVSQDAKRTKALKGYQTLLKKSSSTRVNLLLRCLDEVERLKNDVKGSVTRFGKNSRGAGDNIISRLGSESYIAIESALSAQDFQIAVPCFFLLQKSVLSIADRNLSRDYFVDIRTLLNKEGERVLDAYKQQADLCRGRVTKYLAVFPKESGNWNNPAPYSQDDLYEMTCESLDSFIVSLSYSPRLDFRRWGSAMLNVFRLVPNPNIAKSQADLFDKELKNYTDTHK